MTWGDWRHSLFACGSAIIILFAARAIGIQGADIHYTEILVHSLILTLVAYPFQTLFSLSAMRLFAGRLPFRISATGGCILAALPISVCSPVVSWMAGVLPRSLPAEATRADFWSDLATRYPMVLGGFAVLGTMLWMLLAYPWWRRRIEAAPSSENRKSVPETEIGAPSGEQLILDLVRADRRAQILALSAEGHYLRVRTDAGDDLIHMPFHKALERLGDDDGARIHRSHWVRNSAVDGLLEKDGGLRVRLRTGCELPVSRSYSGTSKARFAFLEANDQGN